MKRVYLNTLTPEEIINRLKNGEVAKRMTTDRGEKIYKMVDGILVKKDKDSITINVGIIVDETNDYYFEEENQFEITETGVYRTRDGRRAYVCDIDTNGDCTFVIDGMRHFMYHATKQGRCHKNIEYGSDLVAKWE